MKLWPGHRVDGPEGRYFTSEKYLKEPLRWNRLALEMGERHRVFCASYADVFEDRPELRDRRARLFDTIAATPHLDWLLLTKRPQNIPHLMPAYRAAGGRSAPWPNVWLGTTVGVKASIPRLIELAAVRHLAAVTFASCEPLIEELDLGRVLMVCKQWRNEDSLRAPPWCPPWPRFQWKPQALVAAGWRRPIDWLIIGGESGSKARPFRLEWARNLIAQCRAAGVAPFVKQLGARAYLEGVGLLDDDDPCAVDVVRVRLKDSHGGDWDEWPADLRLREFPRTVERAAT